MSDLAIAVDIARDVAHRRHTADLASFTERYERLCNDVFAEIRSADATQLGQVIWTALDGPNPKLHLLDDLLAAVRDLTALEYGDQAEHRLAVAVVHQRWRIAQATAVTRIVDLRMKETS